MFKLLKRKHPASAVARELAKAAFCVEGSAREHILKASTELAVSPSCVEAEYLGLRVYILETVVQTISAECEAHESFLSAFHAAIAEQAQNNGISADFWSEQEPRTSAYDIAWQDPKGLGPGMAMASALSARIRSSDAVLTTTPLFLYCSNLAPEFLKCLRSMRIVAG
jgi:hypothetical protein